MDCLLQREEVRRKEKQLVRAQKKQDIETKMTQQLGFAPVKHVRALSSLLPCSDDSFVLAVTD